MNNTPLVSLWASTNSDERGVIVDWLLRTALVLALLGVVLFDSASIAVNVFGLSATADDIAAAVSTDVADATLVTPATLKEQAKPLAKDAGAKLVSIELDDDGILHLTLRRKATTLVVGHIDAFKRWAKASADAEASTNPT